MLVPEDIGLRPVACIAGPTASGKSGLAVRLAQAVGGEIVNADALQVYRDIRVLSARPSEAEQAGVPHHLFGHVDGTRNYSVGDWQADAVPVILDILARHRVPILTGGTGLYFRALLRGLADIPEVPVGVQSEVDGLPMDILRKEAERVDPAAAARVLGDDPQRLARIVGVYRATGQPLSAFRAQTRPIIPDRFVRKVVLLPERATLYARIEARYDAMLDDGGLEEARAVHARNYSARASLPKAIGLASLLSHLDGEIGLERAVEIAKRDSRRLAKRQSTWFRNQCGDWPVLRSDAERETWLATMKAELSPEC